jgi:hypothetical protein
MVLNNKLIFKAFYVFIAKIYSNKLATFQQLHFKKHLLIFLLLGWPDEMASTSMIFAHPEQIWEEVISHAFCQNVSKQRFC